ncbi:hypothetical protein A2482_04520 [Candidatus Falkowbacteria bacterium RIFOXYC2_FULL_48_21]|uniref:Uncharacterized protein n=1 Tax=Candidatus Falkowbacteria bacterium RIFOXYC2_FULL_48_21 TaxID=1798005 RepID=A0A1F5TB57_9BACT|nr:MAG: hypothetical protein A2482_04520 [Candidatus Falkowbacteria bacterium RIFOXYC2_FULL_48_21]
MRPVKFSKSISVAVNYLYGLLNGTIKLEYDREGTPASADWISSRNDLKKVPFGLREIMAEDDSDFACEGSELMMDYRLRKIYFSLSPENSDDTRHVLTITLAKNLMIPYRGSYADNPWFVAIIEYRDYHQPEQWYSITIKGRF